MLYLNECEIDDALQRFVHLSNPIPLRAAKFLAAFRDEVNQHSDGWAYWQAPIRSAAALMQIVATRNWNDASKITEQDFKRALTPIKRFYTTRGNAAGMQFPEVQA